MIVPGGIDRRRAGQSPVWDHLSNQVKPLFLALSSAIIAVI